MKTNINTVWNWLSDIQLQDSSEYQAFAVQKEMGIDSPCQNEFVIEKKLTIK